MLCKIKIKAMFKFSDSRALLNMALIFILHNILTEKKTLQILFQNYDNPTFLGGTLYI